jgi:probable HAF family extracellular repeat protein
MSKKILAFLLVLALLVLLFVPLLFSKPKPPVRYRVVDLGTLGASSSAFAINDKGQIVGGSQVLDGEGSHPFLWSKGVMKNLGLEVGKWGSAWAINRHGDILISEEGDFPVIRNSTGEALIVGVTGAAFFQANDFNDAGQIVGGAQDHPTGNPRACVWDKDDGLRDLGTLPGEIWSMGWRINAKGWVLGISGAGNRSMHAFLWKPETGMEEIDGLDLEMVSGFGMNDQGQVVLGGVSPGQEGYLWEEGKGATYLGTLGGGKSSAKDINNRGEVVGGATLWSGRQLALDWVRWTGLDDLMKVKREDFDIYHAFLWRDGTIYDLNDLLENGEDWVLGIATGINDAGQIVGHGGHGDQYRAFLLDPIKP